MKARPARIAPLVDTGGDGRDRVHHGDYCPGIIETLGIPARSVEGQATGDRHKQSIKCQALRVIIIDELSMISAELLGALAYVTKKAVRAAGSYKKRKDGSTRAFGGVNLVMCVDWWQLQPVSGTCLCSDPSSLPPGRTLDAMEMIWLAGEQPDSIRNFWSLTQLMRCKDIWFNDFLSHCRNGSLPEEMYQYIHGLPTFKSPGNDCTCQRDVVTDPKLPFPYRKSWAMEFMKGCKDMKQLIWESECAACRRVRQARHRVLTQIDSISREYQEPPYSSAPALYSFNVPKYFSIQLRAREFAKQHGKQLAWCHAIDVPLHPEDRELDKEALDRKLAGWLQRHDQETSNLPSLIPLAVGMPIRLTDSVDRDRQLYRGRRGHHTIVSSR